MSQSSNICCLDVPAESNESLLETAVASQSGEFLSKEVSNMSLEAPIDSDEDLLETTDVSQSLLAWHQLEDGSLQVSRDPYVNLLNATIKSQLEKIFSKLLIRVGARGIVKPNINSAVRDLMERYKLEHHFHKHGSGEFFNPLRIAFERKYHDSCRLLLDVEVINTPEHLKDVCNDVFEKTFPTPCVFKLMLRIMEGTIPEPTYIPCNPSMKELATDCPPYPSFTNWARSFKGYPESESIWFTKDPREDVMMWREYVARVFRVLLPRSQSLEAPIDSHEDLLETTDGYQSWSAWHQLVIDLKDDPLQVSQDPNMNLLKTTIKSQLEEIFPKLLSRVGAEAIVDPNINSHVRGLMTRYKLERHFHKHGSGEVYNPLKIVIERKYRKSCRLLLDVEVMNTPEHLKDVCDDVCEKRFPTPCVFKIILRIMEGTTDIPEPIYIPCNPSMKELATDCPVYPSFTNEFETFKGYSESELIWFAKDSRKDVMMWHEYVDRVFWVLLPYSQYPC